VTTDHTLIAGERRLAACTSLGWETIPARIVDLDDPLGAEIDENGERKDFLPSKQPTCFSGGLLTFTVGSG
jgi:ParB family chromosome partitioning protein